MLTALLYMPAGCDKGSPDPGDPSTVGDSEGSSDSESGTDSEGSTTTSDSDSDSSTTEPAPPDACAFLLEGMSPDEIATAWAAAQNSAGGEFDELDELEYCEGVHSIACETSEGESGTSLCVVSWGSEVWTECAVEHACTPDDVFQQDECYAAYCTVVDDVLVVDEWISPDGCCGTDDPCCWTPLVVKFDDEPLRFDTASAAAFDISGQGACLSTDWPSAPWLALDRDGDGVIASGRELFGSGTIMSTGIRADHGFEALAEFDIDGDGKITAADPIFHELVLWVDHDSNRRGTLDELVPVATAELVAIDLGFRRRHDCDERGNCGVERSAFEFRDELGALRNGEIVDVHMPCQ
ncbi:MAG TPA: hypothetical protein ENJ18_06260 [Nannocystis exedens]|nr:hypothetical protein [Nannocystis exedens]